MLNMEDFQINQWMFLFDGFGIAHKNESGLQLRHNETMVLHNQQNAKEIFQPYLVKYMCNSEEVDMNTFENLEEQTKSRFDVYQVELTNKLEPQRDFSEVITRVENGPVYFAQNIEDNKSYFDTPGKEQSVQQYATDLQKKLDFTNDKIMKMDVAKTEHFIERDFFKHQSSSKD